MASAHFARHAFDNVSRGHWAAVWKAAEWDFSAEPKIATIPSRSGFIRGIQGYPRTCMLTTVEG